MVPQIMHSDLTGKWYVVTTFRNDGSAKTKYDVTDQMTAILKAHILAVSLGHIERKE